MDKDDVKFALLTGFIQGVTAGLLIGFIAIGWTVVFN